MSSARPISSSFLLSSDFLNSDLSVRKRADKRSAALPPKEEHGPLRHRPTGG